MKKINLDVVALLKTLLQAVIILLMIWGLFIGCASVGHRIDGDQAAKVQKGITTREQVISNLGSPNQISHLSNGDTIFSYVYARVTTKPATFIPFIGIFFAGANVQNQTFTVTFGTDGIVKDIVSTHGSSESNLGFTTGSKPDVKDTEENKR